MDVPTRALELTKVDAATRQVDAAIEALVRGDFDVAITLAGAAEGMLERSGLHGFAFLRDSPRVQHVEKKEWIGVLNFERDWLKHPTPDAPKVLTIEPWHAGVMIARAASKVEDWTPRMYEFREWLMAHIEQIR
jgi:hypothetical protein